LPAELRPALQTVLSTSTPSPGAADRFVYTLRHGDREVTVGEKALDSEGKRLMQWVMSRGS